MADEKKLNDQELDSVAGGMDNVDLSGSKVTGNQTVIDESVTQVKQDIRSETDIRAGGDIVGRDKTDVDTHTNIKTSLF